MVFIQNLNPVNYKRELLEGVLNMFTNVRIWVMCQSLIFSFHLNDLLLSYNMKLDHVTYNYNYVAVAFYGMMWKKDMWKKVFWMEITH